MQRTDSNEQRRVLLVRQISKIMKTERKARGLSQTLIAKEMGISQSALSKMENGKSTPSLVEWLDFCRITGLTIDAVKI